MPLCLTLHVLHSICSQCSWRGLTNQHHSLIKQSFFCSKGFPPLQQNLQNMICVIQQAASAEILKNTLSFVVKHPSSMENFGPTKNLRNTESAEEHLETLSPT